MHDTSSHRVSLLNGWRIAGWGILTTLLILPALAMRITSEVNWTASDFLFAAMLLMFIGTVIELAVRKSRPGAARAGYVIAGGAAFLTIWINAAVGIIGDDDAINRWFFVLVFVGLFASLIAWFRPRILSWIAAGLAIGQYGVGIAALHLMPGHGVEWGLLTAFALLWAASAWCFRRAAATETGKT